MFVPITEESGLIIPIGEWVLKTACYQIKEWVKSGYSSLLMAVNLSGHQIGNKGLVKALLDIIEETGMEPKNLELELTESILMENAESSIELMDKLKDAGLRLSVDDFGTGYSSLSYLKRFSIDKLKIDKSFIDDVIADGDAAIIASTIIAMGQKLNLKVIAEGVETVEQLRFLQEQGCDEIQGYLFSKPVSAAEITQMLAEGRSMSKLLTGTGAS